MKIKIKCPVCNARNELLTAKQPCRRCGEDLSLLYQSKGYSYKHRVNLGQMLQHPDERVKKQLAQAATWFVRR